jgi:ribosomal protein S19E (S16A)
MTPNLKPATFRLERHLLEGMEEVKRRDGVPVSEQVRRAVTAWLETKGILVKSDRKRGVTATGRKRSQQR